MTEPTPCRHPHLEHLYPDQRRGWLCAECEFSGPTTVEVEVGPTGRAALLCRCVCAWNMRWPYTATGQEVAAFLAEHANCVPDPPLPAGQGVELKAVGDG
jgi:hypothetical protein